MKFCEIDPWDPMGAALKTMSPNKTSDVRMGCGSLVNVRKFLAPLCALSYVLLRKVVYNPEKKRKGYELNSPNG
jgi:hypothetical protein